MTVYLREQPLLTTEDLLWALLRGQLNIVVFDAVNHAPIELVRGGSLHQIDWKATARANKMELRRDGVEGLYLARKGKIV